MDANAQIPLNPRDYLILLALTDGARHGYGLVKDIEEQSSGRVRVDAANLYRTLKKMIGSGLVTEADADEIDDHASADRRRYYRITSFGRDVVRLEAIRLAELTEVARARDLLAEETPA
jgi:DNA-binding PadR family transcriptional regulator